LISVPIVGDLSLRRQLTLLVVVPVVTVLLLVSVAFAITDIMISRQHLAERITTMAKVLGDNCRAALAFDDSDAARKTLSALHAEDDVTFAQIVDAEGNPFTDYRRYGSSTEPLELKPAGVYFVDGQLQAFEPIFQDGELIGTIAIQSDLGILKSRIRLYEFVGLPLVLCSLFLAFALAAMTRRRAEEARLESEANYRTLFESTKAAVMLLNEKGHFFDCNPATLKMFGCSTREEILEKRPDAFSPAIQPCGTDSMTLVQERRAEVFRNGIARFEWMHRRMNGEEFPAEVLLSSMEFRGQKIIQAIVHDISDRKQAEKEREELLARLEQSNRELQDFAFVASHDLQEPLRKITAFGDRLKVACGDQLNEQGRDYVERMQNAANRMQQLIQDLLTFSRVTSRAKDFTSVDLNEAVREVLSDLDSRIQEANAQVDVEPLPVLEAEPTQIRQLLQNLIGNALKYRKTDEAPHVSIRSRKFGVAGNGECCEITVEDNGIGFDEKYLDRVFGMFQRLHGRGEYEGTGIGLAVCRKIVERHKGTITAKSALGQGAAFRVVLPVHQKEKTPQNE